MTHKESWIAMVTVVVSMAGGAYQANAQIGMIASPGDFTIAGVKSVGTATIFNGDVLSTDSVASHVHLSTGIDVIMAPHSSGAIFADHINLTRGEISGQVGSRYRVITAGIALKPSGLDTEAQVQVAENRVTVGIPKGQADITTAQGAIIAHMMPGQAMSYQNVSGQDKTVQALGVLDRQDGHYLVRDRFTNVVSELSGNIPAGYVNKLVRVNGELSADASTVPQVDRIIMVKEIKRSDATSAVPCESDPGGSVAKEMVVDGVLSQEEGHYLIATDRGVVEVMGDVDQAQIGKKVHMKGSIVKGQGAYAPAEQIVYTEKRKFVLSDSPCAGLIAGGMLITAGMLLQPDDGNAAVKQPVSY